MKLLLTAIFILTGSIIGTAQVAAGGSYTLDKSVIAAGGGLSSDQNGTLYTVNGTIGQSAAGANSSGGTYALQSGFHNAAPLAPTAAGVTLSGRAITSTGRGIRNVQIQMTDAGGTTRTATTSAFGYYRFDDVAAGATYILTARGKRYSFTQPTQVVNLNQDLTEINFIAFSFGGIK